MLHLPFGLLLSTPQRCVSRSFVATTMCSAPTVSKFGWRRAVSVPPVEWPSPQKTPAEKSLVIMRPHNHILFFFSVSYETLFVLGKKSVIKYLSFFLFFVCLCSQEPQLTVNPMRALLWRDASERLEGSCFCENMRYFCSKTQWNGLINTNFFSVLKFLRVEFPSKISAGIFMWSSTRDLPGWQCNEPLDENNITFISIKMCINNWIRTCNANARVQHSVKSPPAHPKDWMSFSSGLRGVDSHV